MNLLAFLISLLLGGVSVLIVARILPGFRLKGRFGDAVVVGAVYGLLKALFQTLLIVLTLPFVVVTLGLFIILINALLLALTDKLLGRLEIKSFGSLVTGAVLLSLIDWGFQLLLRQ